MTDISNLGAAAKASQNVQSSKADDTKSTQTEETSLFDKIADAAKVGFAGGVINGKEFVEDVGDFVENKMDNLKNALKDQDKMADALKAGFTEGVIMGKEIFEKAGEVIYHGEETGESKSDEQS